MVRRRVRHKSKAFNVFMMLLFVACLFVIGKAGVFYLSD